MLKICCYTDHCLLLFNSPIFLQLSTVGAHTNGCSSNNHCKLSSLTLSSSRSWTSFEVSNARIRWKCLYKNTEQHTHVPRSTISPSRSTRILSAWITVDSRWATISVVRFSHIFANELWMLRSVWVSRADVAYKLFNSANACMHHHSSSSSTLSLTVAYYMWTTDQCSGMTPSCTACSTVCQYRQRPPRCWLRPWQSLFTHTCLCHQAV